MSDDYTYKIVKNVVEPVESALVSVGINSAAKAGVATAVLASGVFWVVKPAALFDPATGKPRQWALFRDAENPTYLTWWATAAIIGWGVSLII